MELDDSNLINPARELPALQPTETSNEKGDVQPYLLRLLDSLRIDHRPEYQTESQNGPTKPVDFLLRRRRDLIEAKPTEHPCAIDPHKPQSSRPDSKATFEKLRGYIDAKRNKAFTELPFHETPDRQWVGVVSDGKVWHAWIFPREAGAKEVAIPGVFAQSLGFSADLQRIVASAQQSDSRMPVDHKVDRIVANPSWVPMSYVQDDPRQNALEALASTGSWSHN